MDWILCQKFHEGIPKRTDGVDQKTNPAVPLETVEKWEKPEAPLETIRVTDQVLKRWRLGSNSYWKMAGVINPLLSNEVIHKYFKLLDVLGYYKRLHEKRLVLDRSALDWRYHSLFG
jgi:hypothetical protein